MMPGLLATAFPIFDLQGRVILCATALRPEALPCDDAKVLDELGELCLHISAQLGWKER